MNGTAVVLIILVLLVLVVLGVVMSRRRRSSQLQQHFGPEYERSVAATGDRRAAEAELAERRQRREEFDVRDLRPEERGRFRESWNEIQRGFVDDPRQSLKSADLLVAEVMRARGYPVDDDFDRRADDLSVDHPRVVQHYREARKVRDADGEVDTERQRTAFTSYRSLINALLGDDDDHDARQDRTGTRPTSATTAATTGPTTRDADDDARHADVATDPPTAHRPAGTPCATSPARPAPPPTRRGPGAPGPRSTRDDHVRPARTTAATTTPRSTAASASGSWTPCSATRPSSGTTTRPEPGATTRGRHAARPTRTATGAWPWAEAPAARRVHVVRAGHARPTRRRRRRRADPPTPPTPAATRPGVRRPTRRRPATPGTTRPGPPPTPAATPARPAHRRPETATTRPRRRRRATTPDDRPRPARRPTRRSRPRAGRVRGPPAGRSGARLRHRAARATGARRADRGGADRTS